MIPRTPLSFRLLLLLFFAGLIIFAATLAVLASPDVRVAKRDSMPPFYGAISGE